MACKRCLETPDNAGPLGPDNPQEARAIKTAKDRVFLVVLLRVVTLGLIVGALSLLGGEAGQAQAQTPITVGFDMNTAGNSCSGSGIDCTLGPIDSCVHVPTGGGSITFDVFLKDLPGPPSEGGIASFGYRIGEKQDRVVGTVAGYTHTDGAVNLIFARDFDNPQEFSDVVGTTVPFWDALVLDLGETEFNPPYTQGVLSRLTVDVTGASDGLYGLTIEPTWENYIVVGDAFADNYCHPDDAGDGPGPFQGGCDILDAYDGYGLIAVGATACAVGGIAELPEVAGSADSTPHIYIALAGCVSLALVTACAWYARRRRGR